MTNRISFTAAALACGATLAIAGSGNAHAARLYVLPATQEVSVATAQAFFDLMMDFSAAESTVGGGIDISVSGVGRFFSFTPSSYFATEADPAFTGHGTLHADANYEIHFGSFAGLSGLNYLGRITLAMNQPGVIGTVADLALSTNTFFGGFYSATSASPLDVTMTGGTVRVGPVPEPASVALLLGGLCGLGVALRRRTTAGFEAA